MKVVYTPQEAADQMEVSVQTVYRLIRDGKLKANRIGHRTIRIPHDALTEYWGDTSTLATCDTYGCQRHAVKRLEVPRGAGTENILVCAAHWALDYEGRIGPSVHVYDLTTDTQEVSN